MQHYLFAKFFSVIFLVCFFFFLLYHLTRKDSPPDGSCCFWNSESIPIWRGSKGPRAPERSRMGMRMPFHSPIIQFVSVSAPCNGTECIRKYKHKRVSTWNVHIYSTVTATITLGHHYYRLFQPAHITDSLVILYCT